jgi:hypothetical protein
MKTPSGRRASSCSRSIFRIERGSLRSSLPPTASTSKAAEPNFFVMLARRERVEIRDHVIEHDGLATENELPETVPCRHAKPHLPSELGLSLSSTALVGMSNLSEAKTQMGGRGCAAIVRRDEVCGVDRHCVRERLFPELRKRRLRLSHWEIVDQGHENSRSS